MKVIKGTDCTKEELEAASYRLIGRGHAAWGDSTKQCRAYFAKNGKIPLDLMPSYDASHFLKAHLEAGHRVVVIEELLYDPYKNPLVPGVKLRNGEAYDEDTVAYVYILSGYMYAVLPEGVVGAESTPEEIERAWDWSQGREYVRWQRGPRIEQNSVAKGRIETPEIYSRSTSKCWTALGYLRRHMEAGAAIAVLAEKTLDPDMSPGHRIIPWLKDGVGPERTVTHIYRRRGFVYAVLK